MDDTKRAELLEATAERALILRDDLDHIRAILAKPDATPGDIRRMSAQLRRILVEQDLAQISAPRTGRIFLTSPDLKPVYVVARTARIPFFAAAGANLLGVHMAGLMVNASRAPIRLDGYHPDTTLELPLDGFLRQQVVCLEGTWYKRSDLIKHIANVGSGIHSGSLQNDIDRGIRRVRNVVSVSLAESSPSILFNPQATFTSDPPIRLDQNSVDCGLIEIFSAANFLVNSPSVQALEEMIDAER